MVMGGNNEVEEGRQQRHRQRVTTKHGALTAKKRRPASGEGCVIGVYLEGGEQSESRSSQGRGRMGAWVHAFRGRSQATAGGNNPVQRWSE